MNAPFDVRLAVNEEIPELAQVTNLIDATAELLSPLIDNASVSEENICDIIRRKDMILSVLAAARDALCNAVGRLEDFSASGED